MTARVISDFRKCRGFRRMGWIMWKCPDSAEFLHRHFKAGNRAWIKSLDSNGLTQRGILRRHVSWTFPAPTTAAQSSLPNGGAESTGIRTNRGSTQCWARPA